ncbi:MAG: hypothetical protein DI568_04675 [Sphingomonas sp.]|nr:MAG: hypothetical protein DI568_04675 [Sphingomonas sp.]
MRWMLLFATVVAPLAAIPAAAQDGTYRSRTVEVFGNDPCPKASNPDEIIVCARRPEEERYRIPKDIREAEKAAQIAREDQVAANRAAIVSGRTAASGIGSCSAAGAGGITGCTQGLNVVGAAKTIVEGVKTATEPVDD